MTNDKTYQPELDGLRALAVLAVLLCHLDVPAARGGFVGVDIFFVLSGYLITRLIVAELDSTGTLGFRRFYVRRIRRLYPALLSSVAFAWVGAFLLFSPEQLQSFADSTVAALLSWSNLHFYLEADYFDALSITKPLLHTWSLSVEEQFYLVWPLTLVLARRWFGKRGLVVAVGGLGLLSLALAQFWIEDDRTAAFFLLPSRVVELVTGALLVWVPVVRHRWLANVMTTLGVVAMVTPMAVFTAETPFPGLHALLPCVGAAAFIATSSSTAAAPFRWAPVVWIGRISYSLYLLHWPLIVLLRSYLYRSFEGFEPLYVIVLAVALASLQYAFIEQRFRHPVPGKNYVLLIAVALSSAVLIGGSMRASKDEGFPWRLPPGRLAELEKARLLEENDDDAEGDDDAERKPAKRKPTRRLKGTDICSQWQPKLSKKLFSCQNYRKRDKDIFVWGDSHARHLAPGLDVAYPDYNVHVLYLNGCVPQSGFEGFVREYPRSKATRRCIERNQKALRFFSKGPPRNIIITSAKRGEPEEIAPATRFLLDRLRAVGHRVVFLGDFMRPGINQVDCIAAPDYVVRDSWLDQRCIASHAATRDELAYNDRLGQLVPGFVSPNEVQCPNGQCQFFQRGPLYRDDHHLNPRGSKLMVGRLAPLLPF